MSCGAVILAAGASRRLGAPKQLVEYNGRALVVDAAEKAREAGCHPIVVVTGAHAAAIEAGLVRIPWLTIARNDDWASGAGTSVAAGVRAMTSARPALSAVLMLVCDQPLIPVAHLRAVIEATDDTDIDIAATRHADGSGGVPACFSASCFDDLLALRGPAGARSIIADSGRRVRCFETPSASLDVDTPDDVARLGSGR